MQFQTPLVPARLIRRYKRFLSDFRLEDGREVTAHCPNPGSMLGLAVPGAQCWLEPNDDPKRKLKFGWRIVELGDGHYAGIDTSVPNRLVGAALREQRIEELAAYRHLQPEVRYGKRSRVDFLLRESGLPDTYVEVKNVHLRRQFDWAEFPDSVTSRGARHLEELSGMVAQGHRAIMFYLVQRTDCGRFRLADDLDPAYAAAFSQARAAGVEAICYDCAVSPDRISLRRALPVLV